MSKFGTAMSSLAVKVQSWHRHAVWPSKILRINFKVGTAGRYGRQSSTGQAYESHFSPKQKHHSINKSSTSL
eukprot:814293-Karenia_brevis.AAC.1